MNLLVSSLPEGQHQLLSGLSTQSRVYLKSNNGSHEFLSYFKGVMSISISQFWISTLVRDYTYMFQTHEWRCLPTSCLPESSLKPLQWQRSATSNIWSIIKPHLFPFFFLSLQFTGIAVIVCGSIVIAREDYSSIVDDDVRGTSIFLIVVGCVVTVVTFLGCCGAMKENKCMLYTVSSSA